jgi:hypothetical protein
MRHRVGFALFLPAISAFGLAISPPDLPRADAAPPLTPPASSIASGGSTRVQMWSEIVILDATGLATEDGLVLVTTRFRMRNTGVAPEDLRVRFPLEHPGGWGDGYGGYPLVENLEVFADGQPLETGEALEPTYLTQLDAKIRWATFDVHFPVERDVILTVEYTIHAAADEFGTRLDYVMETGAGWAGSIERAAIILLLPYAATRDAYLGSLRSDAWTSPVYSGNTMRWVRWHVEPTEEDNFEALLVPPHLWYRILTLQRRIANGVGIESDYLAQAEAYWLASRSFHGYISHPHLFEAAQAVVNCGLRRLPGSLDLTAEGAFFRLERLYGSVSLAGQGFSPSEQREIHLARCQIAQAVRAGSTADIVQRAAAIYGISRLETECAAQ